MEKINLVLNIISALIIPTIALLFAWRGVRSWQIDKMMQIHSNIKSEMERVLSYKYDDEDIIDLDYLLIGLLDEIEILSSLIRKKYLLIDDKLKSQIFDSYIRFCYENDYILSLIQDKRKKNIDAYCYIEELYNNWNKKK